MLDGFLSAKRARSVAITNSAIPIGTIFGLVVTPIIILRLGWEWAFYLYGGLGFIWYIYWQKDCFLDPKRRSKHFGGRIRIYN